MHQAFKLGGEGASTNFLLSETPPVPAVVVLPIVMPFAAIACSAQCDIYRLAYELAQAALRPSPFELATRFVAN